MEGFTTKKQPFTTVWKMHTAGDAQWYPAQVPGTVYTDLLRNGQMEDPFWKDNEYKALDLMEKITSTRPYSRESKHRQVKNSGFVLKDWTRSAMFT